MKFVLLLFECPYGNFKMVIIEFINLVDFPEFFNILKKHNFNVSFIFLRTLAVDEAFGSYSEASGRPIASLALTPYLKSDLHYLTRSDQ